MPEPGTVIETDEYLSFPVELLSDGYGWFRLGPRQHDEQGDFVMATVTDGRVDGKTYRISIVPKQQE